MTVTRRRPLKVGALTYKLLYGYLIVEGSNAGAFHLVILRTCKTLNMSEKGPLSRASADTIIR